MEKPIRSLFKTIIVTGPDGSGKTLFGLTSPLKPILHVDFHDSARLYEMDKRLGLEFARLDMKDRLWTSKEVQDTIAKGWGTIVIDTIEELWMPFMSAKMQTQEIQQLLANKQNQIALARIARDFQTLMKGVSKHCELLILVAWEGKWEKQPYPRCPRVMLQLSDAVLRLERNPNQAIPSGTWMRLRASGFPPRLPKADWATIAHYIQNPVDFNSLKPEEQVSLVPETLTVSEEETFDA